MIYIRGDGNARIGAGHLMRCMTIAEELARLQGSKEKICFVCADEDSGALVRENGFRSYVLGTDYRDMESELPLWRKLWERQRQEDGSDGDRDIVNSFNGDRDISGGFDGDSNIMDGSDGDRDIVNSFNGGRDISGGFDGDGDIMDGFDGGRDIADCSGRDSVIVDSYYVTDDYLAAVRENAYTVLMDDMGTHCYPVDCVINYNAPASPDTYRKLYQGSGTKLLIGSRYTPLRRQFRRAEEIPDEGTGQLPAVLITVGGGDSGNIAWKILKRIYRKNFSFHLVTGRFHPDFQRMQELEKAHNNIHIHHDVKNMAGLMRRCQIAVTAGGSTVYELSALGIPFVCFSCAENQEALVDYIGSRQIAVSAGAWHREPEQTLERIGSLFEKLAENPRLREACRYREMKLTDGNGAHRLAEEILRPD